ncbi:MULTISPECIES: metallophosphoesterase [Marinobacter]|nr:metallophosphoesterase [Marinobacter salarius]WOI21370.1 metallophosphoesterase [Marinobacter salarius]
MCVIHAGDALGRGTLEEQEQLDASFGRQNHTHKILIAGNHDWCFERREPNQ